MSLEPTPTAYAKFTAALERQDELKRNIDTLQGEVDSLSAQRLAKTQASGDPRKLGAEIATIDGTSDVLKHRIAVAQGELKLAVEEAIRTALAAARECSEALRSVCESYSTAIDEHFTALGEKLGLGAPQSTTWAMFGQPAVVVAADLLAADLFGLAKGGGLNPSQSPSIVSARLVGFEDTLAAVKAVAANIQPA